MTTTDPDFPPLEPWPRAALGDWQTGFRQGLAPLLSTAELLVLARALREDDPRLIQGATSSPPPLDCVRDWPVEAACLLGYAGWQGAGRLTVAEVEAHFARLCFDMDDLLHEAGGCRHLLNWFDEVPRDEMLAGLLPLIEEELARRATEGGSPR